VVFEFRVKKALNLGRLGFLEELEIFQQVRCGEPDPAARRQNSVALPQHPQTLLIGQMFDDLFRKNVMNGPIWNRKTLGGIQIDLPLRWLDVGVEPIVIVDRPRSDLKFTNRMAAEISRHPAGTPAARERRGELGAEDAPAKRPTITTQIIIPVRFSKPGHPRRGCAS
jgi:hypothetical protein